MLRVNRGISFECVVLKSSILEERVSFRDSLFHSISNLTPLMMRDKSLIGAKQRSDLSTKTLIRSQYRQLYYGREHS